MPRRKRIIVVGAGVAGLTAAAALAHAGYATTVLEKQAVVGGRAAQATWDGFTFDLGPTLLFMLDVFRTAFASWGGDFDREVPTVRLRPSSRLNLANGRRLIISPVLSDTMASLEDVAPGSSAGVLRYLAGSARAYEISMREFVDEPVRSFAQYMTPRKIRALVGVGAFKRLSTTALADFGNPDVAAAFSLQSMYLGMSPFTSPLMYRLLLFSELGQGTYFPLGGIGSLVRALERAARGNGAAIHYGSEVTSLCFDGKTVCAVNVGNERIEADGVLFTADLPYVYRHLFGAGTHRSTRMQLTPSALLLYVALKSGYDDLLHHEFLMPANLRETCNDLFRRKRVPGDMAIYLCAPAKTDRSMAPAGSEALYVLVPTPNLEGREDWSGNTNAIAEEVLNRIEKRRLPGLRSRIAFYKTRTPADFETEMNLHRGSAFGLSHGLTQIGPLRPANRHARFRNAYFAGASTRPATGLPLVTVSAMQAVRRITDEMPAVV